MEKQCLFIYFFTDDDDDSEWSRWICGVYHRIDFVCVWKCGLFCLSLCSWYRNLTGWYRFFDWCTSISLKYLITHVSSWLIKMMIMKKKMTDLCSTSSPPFHHSLNDRWKRSVWLMLKFWIEMWTEMNWVPLSGLVLVRIDVQTRSSGRINPLSLLVCLFTLSQDRHKIQVW